MQSLVYLFIALAVLGVGAAAYFGFTFTPIEALVTAGVFGCLAVLLLERSLRRRAEVRLEKAIEDLSRLLSTDAQAGAVLSQRINALSDENAGRRLEGVEADISVLGTVVRQVAEAVADLEAGRKDEETAPAPVRAAQPAVPVPDPDTFPEPVIPAEMLRQAIDENRLVFHIMPIVVLPQRRTAAYDLVPRLVLEDGELADPPDFMPRRGADEIVRRIESMATDEAVTIARRARTAGQPILLNVPLSRVSLSDSLNIEQLSTTLDANRAIAPAIIFAMPETDWRALSITEKASMGLLARHGVGFSLTTASSLRVDFAELGGEGFRSIRVDAGRFLSAPQAYTDFHTSDIASYIKRFGLDLVMTGIKNEQQILTLLEDGITHVQGAYIAPAGPVRPDLMLPRAQASAAGARRVPS